MNRYILIRRLRGPAILLLLGIVALLHEANLLDGWNIFFPLLLILIGVLKLAERAALAAAGDAAMYQGGPYPYGVQPTAAQPQPGTSIVPAPAQDYSNSQTSGGGQS
jgi:hypothetical protein